MIDYSKMLRNQIKQKEQWQSHFAAILETAGFFWEKYCEEGRRNGKLEYAVCVLVLVIILQSAVFIFWVATRG